MKRAVKLLAAAHGVLGRLWAMVDSRKMSTRLYDKLNAVFARISRIFVSMTLSECHERFNAREAAPVSELQAVLA